MSEYTMDIEDGKQIQKIKIPVEEYKRLRELERRVRERLEDAVPTWAPELRELFKKGEKIQKIGCPIVIQETRKEPLIVITSQECALEGFPHMKPLDFVEMLCDHYNIGPETNVNRIKFSYSNEEESE